MILRYSPTICHTLTALTNDAILAEKCFLFYSNHVLKKPVLSGLQFRLLCSRIIRVASCFLAGQLYSFPFIIP